MSTTELKNEENADVTDEEISDFKDQLKPILASLAKIGVVGGIMAGIKKMTTTNYERKGLTGDVKLKPTEEETVISKSEVAGNETEGKLSKDGVNGTEGEIKANETKGIASTAEATAADTGAQAMRTKAGAMEVKTKGLEIQ